MHLLPATAFRRMPWKNGGGETIEIAAFPEGASLDDFDWRVSMARVAASGPFSSFPGVDRTIAVLGDGELVLRFHDATTVVLTRESEPYSFPADVPVDGLVPADAVTDLNVMTRRGRVAHRLRRIGVDAPLRLDLPGEKSLLLALEGAVELEAGGRCLRIASGDAAVLSGRIARAASVAPVGAGATLYAASFRRQ